MDVECWTFSGTTSNCDQLGYTRKPMFRDSRLTRMAAFLGSIGIEMRPGTIDVPTVFPGSFISGGSLVVDESLLVAPGDALHEAAHIALAPPGRRSTDSGKLKRDRRRGVAPRSPGPGLRCWSSTCHRRMSSTAPPIKAATRLPSSIAGAAVSTSASRFSRHGGWHSTRRMHAYAA